MRKTFIAGLTELAAQDSRIVLLTADLGYTVLEPFAERYPDRFFNVGVAEQNMLGLATGLAHEGYIPFVYSIATFAAIRPYEFIRNGPVLHELPVRIVGVGGGFDYGAAGITHHALEDIGLMRLQPGLRVVVPADYKQAATALRATWDLHGPVYYRLGKDDVSAVPELDGRFDLRRNEILRTGSDYLLIVSGSMVFEAMAAAESLDEHGLSVTVAVVSCFNPSPVDDLTELMASFPEAATIEEHYITGGLGSMVAEVIAEQGLACRLKRLAIAGPPAKKTGSQEYLRRSKGLSRDSIISLVLGTDNQADGSTR